MYDELNFTTKKVNYNPNLPELKKQRDLTLGELLLNKPSIWGRMALMWTKYSKINFCVHCTCNTAQTYSRHIQTSLKTCFIHTVASWIVRAAVTCVTDRAAGWRITASRGRYEAPSIIESIRGNKETCATNHISRPQIVLTIIGVHPSHYIFQRGTEKPPT